MTQDKCLSMTQNDFLFCQWLGGEDVSESYERETNDIDNRNLAFTGEVDCRDMRDADDKSYSDETEDEAETKEDADEGWGNQKHLPLTGRISKTMEELERLQISEAQISDEIHQCLKDSLDCYQTCTETTLKCLTLSGKLAAPEHLNLLTDCAKICSANADFILRNSTYFTQICGLTADICDECADTCDRFKDDFMKKCAIMCRRCAESCREITR